MDDEDAETAGADAATADASSEKALVSAAMQKALLSAALESDSDWGSESTSEAEEMPKKKKGNKGKV